MAREDDTADRLDDGDLGQVLGTAPTVDGKGKRPAHANVVEGLHLVVGGHEQGAVPVALLDGELLAQRLHQIVTHLRRETTELDVGAPAANRLHVDRILLGEDGLGAVEIGLALPIIGLIALGIDVRSRLPFDELERPRAQHVLLVPVHVGIEDLLGVDEVVRKRQRRNEGARGILQFEHDREIVGRGDAFDHAKERLAVADDSLHRENELLIGGDDVMRVELGAADGLAPFGGLGRRLFGDVHTMPLDALPDLEGVQLAAVGRLGHVADAQIALEIRRRRRVGRVDPEQDAVELRERVNRPEGRFLMGIGAWRVGRDDVFQDPAAILRRRIGADTPGDNGEPRRQRDGYLAIDLFHFRFSFPVFIEEILRSLVMAPPPIREAITPPCRPPSGPV